MSNNGKLVLDREMGDQRREALSALGGKVAPDLLVKLRDVCQLDLFLEGEAHIIFEAFALDRWNLCLIFSSSVSVGSSRERQALMSVGIFDSWQLAMHNQRSDAP